MSAETSQIFKIKSHAILHFLPLFFFIIINNLKWSCCFFLMKTFRQLLETTITITTRTSKATKRKKGSRNRAPLQCVFLRTTLNKRFESSSQRLDSVYHQSSLVFVTNTSDFLVSNIAELIHLKCLNLLIIVIYSKPRYYFMTLITFLEKVGSQICTV